jgi:hypothetical protein
MMHWSNQISQKKQLALEIPKNYLAEASAVFARPNF